jgi:hypothetical protein
MSRIPRRSVPRRRIERTFTAGAIAALLLVAPLADATAQDSPFVSDTIFQLLNGEISGDAAFETIRVFTRYHRMGNSPGFTAAADYLYEQAVAYGLEDVVRLKQPVGSPAWSASDGEIWITSPVLMKLADMTDVQLMLADYSRSVDLEAELVDVGNGTSDADYEGKDVRGRVVFASGSPSTVTSQAVFRRGAVGVITTALRSTSQPWDHPDQIPWQSVPRTSPAGSDVANWFGFTLSARRGDELRALLEGRALPPEVAFTGADPGGPVRVKVHIVSTFDESDTDTEFIEARINGTDPSLPAIVFTCHIQEEKFSANDDASGCANVLEIARAIKHLIDTGMIDRPRRTLRFWWANEISGPYWYFRAHPDERARVMATLHEDMVGAKQTEGSRVQHIIRSPHHQASYLADVVQSVAEMVISGNSGYLAALQVGSPYPYSRPIFSRLGTRDGYRAEIVPNFNNSDHMVFNDGIIGIPAVGFINWPDDYIHSSDDDLWQIDPTQLKRNAFIIAASALYLANAGPDEVPTLLADVMGRGSARQGKDLQVAMQHLAAAAPADRAGIYRQATYIIEAGAKREVRALNSIMDFVEGANGRAHMIEHAAEQVNRTASDNLTSLAGFYGGLTGDAAPELRMAAGEREASRKVPVNIDDVDRYLSDRPRPNTGLHGLMTFSVWGHVDGETSYLDIYKQVMAEAAVHGSWYYGTVTLDQVVRTLDAGVQAGIIVIR